MGQDKLSKENSVNFAHAPCGFRLPLKVPPEKASFPPWEQPSLAPSGCVS